MNAEEQNVEGAGALGRDEFLEAAAPHGEAVMFVARGVGVLVAIAAVLFAILLMMVIRAFIGIILQKVGVSGIGAAVVLALWIVTRIGGVSPKLVWRVFTRSCC